jgi:Txe/YoeB family toxin of Txe-Axe toxin-antitoxin module
MKEDFVNKVLADTAQVNYYSISDDLLRKDAEAQIPKTIKELISDPLTEPYIGNFYVRSTAVGMFCGIQVKGAYNIKPSDECEKELIEIQKLLNAQIDKTRALKAELLGAISKCRSTQQISKQFPELVKYLPKDPWEAAENPPAVNVIQHLIEAGWPDSEK